MYRSAATVDSNFGTTIPIPLKASETQNLALQADLQIRYGRGGDLLVGGVRCKTLHPPDELKIWNPVEVKVLNNSQNVSFL